MTLKEAEKKLKLALIENDWKPDEIESVDQLGEALDDTFNWGKSKQLEEYTVKCEDEFGGEGQGDTYWSIYSINDGENKTYVQFSGWYNSWAGSEYTDMQIVEPYKVEVTRWRNVK